jgi:hypothetical protein
MSTDVSEKRFASIFRVEEYANQETSVKPGRLTFNGLHGVIFQKIVHFITTAPEPQILHAVSIFRVEKYPEDGCNMLTQQTI